MPDPSPRRFRKWPSMLSSAILKNVKGPRNEVGIFSVFLRNELSVMSSRHDFFLARKDSSFPSNTLVDVAKNERACTFPDRIWDWLKKKQYTK